MLYVVCINLRKNQLNIKLSTQRRNVKSTDLIFSLSMGVLARNYEKIYFRENVVVTKNLSTSLGQQCTQLQFGMLFIIVQNLEIFCGGFFQ